MKKMFNLPQKDFNLWRLLVEIALKKSDFIKFNILFSGHELALFLEDFAESNVILKCDIQKFYCTGDVLEIKLNSLQQKRKFIEKIKMFDVWKNNFIEDPSFWDGETEFLGCISHENIVMIDTNYYDEGEIKGVDLFNLPVQ